jgi:hypothetical protein
MDHTQTTRRASPNIVLDTSETVAQSEHPPSSSRTPVQPGSHLTPAPPETEESLERKRRHTAAEHERRQFETFMRVSGNTSHTRLGVHDAHPRRSQISPFDLTTAANTTSSVPSRYSQSVRMAHTRGSVFSREDLPAIPATRESQRPGEVTLPPWQPDADASSCPVCGTDFTFWYRKHHCRKCGRVVCATCSPHRITIPRQYIVQPPSQGFDWDDDQEDLSASQENAASSTLTGGETVRVCNPCVPDPWVPDTSRGERSMTIPASQSSGRPRMSDAERQAAREAFIAGGTFTRAEAGDGPLSRYRSHSHQPGASHRGALPPHQHILPPFAFQNGQEALNGMGRTAARHAAHRHTLSSGHQSYPFQLVPDGYRRPVNSSRPLPPLPPSAHPPRRQVKEEDECPVCGEEMPPGEAMRAEHIQDCISTRFSSTPTRSTAAPVSPGLSPPTSSTRPVASTSTSLPAVSTLGSRPRAPSYRPRGMAVYLATEKDCTTGDGEPQECVICFEEFQAGDELGRMECLCKFHRACIRQWWDTKGTGSCPTHQLHD